jgi:ribosomal protein L11 methyltransferase
MNPDRWLELRLRVPDGAGELAVEALLEEGGRAVWEEDGWQVSHLPDPGDDGLEVVVDRVRSGLAGVGEVEVETRWQRQEDWAEFWKRGLEARRVTDRLVVTPTWIEPEVSQGDLVITLDPKMAFGNAEHGTTRGCMRLMDGLVREGDRLLDVGAGSAILSIAGALFGAAMVEAVEADPLAIPAAEENLEANGVASRVRLRQHAVTAEDLAAMDPFDGVMANLESGFLKPLLPGLARATRPGGWLLLSGILDHEWEEMRDRTTALGLEFATVDADGEWRSLLFRRPSAQAASR